MKLIWSKVMSHKLFRYVSFSGNWVHCLANQETVNWLSWSAAWPRRLKCRFYGDRAITIAWSRFNTHSHRIRCCVLG